MTTLEVLRKLNAKTDAQVYITGGYVRDYFLGKGSKDLDTVVLNMSIQKITNFLRGYGKIKHITLSKTNDHFDISFIEFHAFDDDVIAQISLPRKGKNQEYNIKNTLRDDVGHRDFTINALYLPVDFERREDVIDMVGGVRDINKGVIRAVGNAKARLDESPVRLFRAVSIAARTRFDINDELKDAIKECIGLGLLHKKKIPIENIRDEFSKIILSEKPSKYINILLELGLLDIIAPEVSRSCGVKQDEKHHKFDVYNHLLNSCDNVRPDLILRLAALLHDIGKSSPKIVRNKDKITFHNHEIVGAEECYTRLRLLKYSYDVVEAVTHLVRHHMYHYTGDVMVCTNDNCGYRIPCEEIVGPEIDTCPLCSYKMTKSFGWTDAAVRRFIRTVNITKEDIKNGLDNFPLFQLRAAERLGNGYKKIAVSPKQESFQRRIESVFNKTNMMTVKDLAIDGYDIMKIFNLKPSQKVGMILNYLLERLEQCVDNGEKIEDLNQKIVLLKIATEYVADNCIVSK